MRRVFWGVVCALAAAVCGVTALSAQDKLAAAAPVTYNNKVEIYGGIAYMGFQAGQNLPTRMNLGGVEVSGTYWVTHRIGAIGDFRGDAGTTQIFPNPQFLGKALVVLYTGMGGVELRGPRNQRFALDYHAMGGVSHGDFHETGVSATQSGLYTDRTKPMMAFGGSLDLNRTKRVAFRLSPDLIIEHYGTEYRIFPQVSAGLLYRLGKR